MVEELKPALFWSVDVGLTKPVRLGKMGEDWVCCGWDMVLKGLEPHVPKFCCCCCWFMPGCCGGGDGEEARIGDDESGDEKAGL